MVDRLREVLQRMIEPKRRAAAGRDASLSVAQIAERLGLAASTVYGWVSNDRDMPVRLVPALTHITGDTSLIEALCDACGGVFQAATEGVAVEGALVTAVKEFGEAISAASDLAHFDADRVHAEILEARQALANLEASVQQQAMARSTNRVATLRDTSEVRRHG